MEDFFDDGLEVFEIWKVSFLYYFVFVNYFVKFGCQCLQDVWVVDEF